MTTVEPNDPDFGLSDQDKKSIDKALSEGGENMERETQSVQQENKEQEPVDHSWTSIDMYYRGFHIKKSVPSNLTPDELKKGIDKYADNGFEPSWNSETNKSASNPKEVGQTPEAQTAPICGIHSVPMVERKGQYGMFYACPTKLGDGSWCKFKPPKK